VMVRMRVGVPCAEAVMLDAPTPAKSASGIAHQRSESSSRRCMRNRARTIESPVRRWTASREQAPVSSHSHVDAGSTVSTRAHRVECYCVATRAVAAVMHRHADDDPSPPRSPRHPLDAFRAQWEPSSSGANSSADADCADASRCTSPHPTAVLEPCAFRSPSHCR
jgi:hypothetical protein